MSEAPYELTAEQAQMLANELNEEIGQAISAFFTREGYPAPDAYVAAMACAWEIANIVSEAAPETALGFANLMMMETDGAIREAIERATGRSVSLKVKSTDEPFGEELPN